MVELIELSEIAAILWLPALRVASMRAPAVGVAIVLVRVHAEPKMCPSPSGVHPCACIREVESGTRAEERSDANY